MRGPISICLNPPAFGRSRTKAGGFVRSCCPSGELSGHSVAEWAKPLTDSGDLAGRVGDACKLGFIGVLIRMEYPPCDTLPVGGGALDAPFTDGL